VIALLAAAAEAGPWTRPAGSWYAKLGFDLYIAPEYVSPVTLTPGAAASGTTGYRGEQVGAYVELGVLPPDTWRVQLAIAAPLSVGHTHFAFDNGFGEIAGHATVGRLGDVRLTPQVALHPTAPLAAALEIKVPGYRNDSVCADNPYRIYCPRPGDGQVDLTPELLAGLSRGKVFGEAAAGWRIRTDWVLGAEGPVTPLGDGPAFSVGGGWNAAPVLLMARVEGNFVPDPEDETTPEAVRAGPAALWTLDEDRGLGLEARFMADLWARGTSRGIGGGLGVSARR
jgi:hypothetical protein